MFTSKELSPVRGLTESKDAYRARRAHADRRVAEYLANPPVIWMSGVYGPAANPRKWGIETDHEYVAFSAILARRIGTQRMARRPA